MSRKEQAALWFIGALAVSIFAQKVIKNEAAVLGLTQLELALIGLAVPLAVKRLA